MTKKQIRLATLILSGALMSGFLSSDGKSIENTPVSHLDTERYQGRWYEIARLDHIFERGMENVTAEYTLRPDGKITVVNRSTKNGKPKSIEGLAWPADNGGNGRLKVRFFLFPSEYIVMNIDEQNYSYSLVGSTSPRYLWILSRTPSLPPDTLSMLIEDASRRGYDTSKLIYVKQNTVR